MCPSADWALKYLGMRQSTFCKNIIDSQSHAAALVPLGIMVNILQNDPALICRTFLGKVLYPIPRYCP